MVGDARRDQPADQIAGDVAGDVGGEGRGGIGGAVVLAEISEGEGEGGGHAQALHHPKRGEHRKIWRKGEERGRDREQHQADEDAEPPVDGARVVADREAGDEHAEGGGIGGKAHLARGDAVMGGQRRQNGLGGEQVDEAQERRERNDDRAQEGSRRAGRGVGGLKRAADLCHDLAPLATGEKWGDAPRAGASPPGVRLRGEEPHMVWSFGSLRISAERSTTVPSLRFFHQCETSDVSATTSPALCVIGAAQFEAYSLISPSMM